MNARPNFRKAVRVAKLQQKNRMIGKTFDCGTGRWPAPICGQCGELFRLCECPETIEKLGPIAARLGNHLWRDGEEK